MEFDKNRYLLRRLKTPVNYLTLRDCDQSDPANHTTLETAQAIAQLAGEDYGVGYSVCAPYVFIDLDHCINHDGSMSALATEILALCDGAYVEISQGGDGLHIVGSYVGELPAHRCNISPHKIPGFICDCGSCICNRQLELYTDKRMISLTGTARRGSVSHDITAATTDIITRYLARDVRDVTKSTWTEVAEIDYICTDDNETLINRACHHNANFSALWHGDTSSYKSASEADLALACHLMFWTGKNCARVLELLQSSTLARDKYDRPDYLERTVRTAYARQVEYFKPREVVIEAREGKIYENEIKPWSYPQLNTGGKKPLKTLANLKYLLEQKDIKVRWNLMKKMIECAFTDFTPRIDDSENLSLTYIQSLCEANHLTAFPSDKYAHFLSYENAYHPVAEKLDSIKWDGRKRLADFTQTLQSPEPELTELYVTRWMTSAIAAARTENGHASQGVLVLSGDQNVGKTSWLKALDPWNMRAVQEGAALDPNNKDHLISTLSYWIVEIGELDGSFLRSDNASFKRFFTSASDYIRWPYMPKPSYMPRRTVYAATVNKRDFLGDTTGNRRYWTVETTAIHLDHGINIEQVWAEVDYMFKSGASHALTRDEIVQLNDHNSAYTQIDPLEEKIRAKFAWSEERKFRMSTTQVLEILGFSNVTKSDATRASAILSKMTGEKPSRDHTGRFHILPRVIA